MNATAPLGVAAAFCAFAQVSLFTLLAVSTGADGLVAKKGLQCKSPDGAWHDCVPPPGSLVLLVGDLLEESTGGLLQATRHRVSAPEKPNDTRQSIVFFATPRPDMVLGHIGTTYDKWRKKRVKRAMKALREANSKAQQNRS